MLLVILNRRDGFRFQPTQSGGQTDETRHIVIAGFELVGQCVRLAIFVAARAGASLPQALQFAFQSRADVEQAGAQRAEQSFMAWCGEQIGLHFVDRQRHVAERLGGIDEKARAVTAHDAANFCHWFDHAGDIRSVQYGDQSRVGPQGAADVVGITRPVASHCTRVTSTWPCSSNCRRGRSTEL